MICLLMLAAEEGRAAVDFVQLQKSVVFLAQQADPKGRVCSGSFIGKNEILTAAHCLGKDSDDYLIVTSDDRYYPVLGVVADALPADLVVLRGDVPDGFSVEPLKIASGTLRYGDLLTRISSNAFIHDSILSGGLLSFFGPFYSPGVNYTARIKTVYGMSGSPVVNSAGEIVGVAAVVRNAILNPEPDAADDLYFSAASQISAKTRHQNPIPISTWVADVIQKPEGEYLFLETDHDTDLCGDENKAALREMVRERPQFAEPLVLLGRCSLIAYQVDEAIRYFEEASALKKNPMLLSTLAGITYQYKRDVDKTAEYLREAIALSPYERSYSDLLSLMYWGHGKIWAGFVTDVRRFFGP